MTNPAIKEAINYEMLFSQDEVKRRVYELQEKAVRDYNAVMLYNRKEGIKEEKIRGAVNGLKANLSFDVISIITGLSIEEIKKIQKQYL